jgi:ATP-dependent Clp protease ATP-binding subunit ClpA
MIPAAQVADAVANDLSALARQGKLDPVIGRDKEIETTIEGFCRCKDQQMSEIDMRSSAYIARS